MDVFRDGDAPLAPLQGARIAVLGYGNQGSSWARNLRDSGLDVVVGTISDDSRRRAADDGFAAHDIPAAVEGAAVVCALIPDEVLAEVMREHIGPALAPETTVCVASGYGPTFEDLAIPDTCDVVLVAPRMLGEGVRDHYVDGTGFITFVSVERDATGRARERMLAVARGIGGTRRGALELDARREALLDLFIEQAVSPALSKVWGDAALVLLEAGIPLEAILVEFYLSGEVERAYRALREDGYRAQATMHSETSQYGTLSRVDRFADLDIAARLRAIADEIDRGSFAEEWAAERAAGYPRLKELRTNDPRSLMADAEGPLRDQLG